MKREEVEITTPEEMEELTGGFAKGDADVIEKTGRVKEREAKGEIYVCLNCGEPLSGEFDVCPYCGEPLIKQSGREESTGVSYEESEELKTESQDHVRDFVSASEIYGKMESKTYDSELFEKLRRLRTDLARERNIRPYMFFQDSVLKEMATKMPTTKEGIMHIKGIRDRKYEEYGEVFLNVIRTHLSERK